MEFYLIKEAQLELSPADGGGTGVEKLRRKSKPLAIKLKPVVGVVGDDKRGYNEGDYLADSLVEDAGKIKGMLHSQKLSPCLKLFMSLDPTQPGSTNQLQKGHVWICSADSEDDGADANKKDPTISIFERLRDVYGHDNVKVNFKLGLCSPIPGNSRNKRLKSDFIIPGQDLGIKRFSGKGMGAGAFGCELLKQNFPTSLVSAWADGKSFPPGELTVTVTLNHASVNKLFLQKFCNWQLHDKSRAALEEAFCSDLVIEAANAALVKCHKVYLAVSSQVLKDTLEKKMEKAEGTTKSVLKMTEMSEAGVRALLAFIYHWDLIEASKSCDVAFELYQAAHKYKIADLEDPIERLILGKTNKWFSVDIAVKLFVFTNKLTKDGNGELDDLLKKSVQILKEFELTSSSNLVDSEEYRRLFRDNYQDAMQLAKYFLKAP